MSDPSTEGFYTIVTDAEDFDRYTGQEEVESRDA